MMTKTACFLLAALTLAMGAGTASAQKAPKPLPVLRGTIEDTLRHPLEGAQVEIMGLNRVLTTTSSGSYRFDEIKPGKYWVVVRRIGYAPLRTALTLNQGDDREIVFELEPLPYNLPEVKVRGEDLAWKRKYQDFVWRSKASFRGYFLTRDDIERSHAYYLGDVVGRYLPFHSSQSFFSPSFNDFGSGMASFGSSRGSRFMANGCSPAVSLNGVRPMGGWAVNDFDPKDVEAVEVYRFSNQMPFEFQSWNVPCGLVVVWTN